MWRQYQKGSGEKRIRRVFERLKREGKRALIPYITAGDPDPERSLRLLNWLSEKGADIIEVGIPFSDPMADGPTIQRAMERALRNRTDLRQILLMVKRFRQSHETPIILMGYMNPFFAYGLERVVREAKMVGVDALLAVDLPPEEAQEFSLLLRREGVASIFLATPVTHDKRIGIIGRFARGFVYFVSVTGVTGEREEIQLDIVERIASVRRITGLPTVLGFGVASARIIEEFFPYVDGFVVGSAIVRRWEEAGFDADSEPFKSFFPELERACHRPFS
jgi:tryptophan synthase alpha chain